MWRETVRAVLRDHRTHLAAASSISFASGAAASWVVLRKRLEEKYANLATEEIRQAKEFYRTQVRPEIVVESDGPEIDPEDVAEAVQILERYQGRGSDEELLAKVREADEALDPAPEARELAGTTRNIFDDPVPAGEAVLGSLFADRSPDKPYIITKDEFYENEGELNERTFSWFAGDGVLAAEDDSVIPDIERTVGEDNLLRFGYGSDDPTIVYIRNEKMQMVIEVSKSEGKYAHEVAGFSGNPGAHIEHSERPRKMRRGYDE